MGEHAREPHSGEGGSRGRGRRMRVRRLQGLLRPQVLRRVQEGRHQDPRPQIAVVEQRGRSGRVVCAQRPHHGGALPGDGGDRQSRADAVLRDDIDRRGRLCFRQDLGRLRCGGPGGSHVRQGRGGGRRADVQACAGPRDLPHVVLARVDPGLRHGAGGRQAVLAPPQQVHPCEARAAGAGGGAPEARGGAVRRGAAFALHGHGGAQPPLWQRSLSPRGPRDQLPMTRRPSVVMTEGGVMRRRRMIMRRTWRRRIDHGPRGGGGQLPS